VTTVLSFVPIMFVRRRGAHEREGEGGRDRRGEEEGGGGPEK